MVPEFAAEVSGEVARLSKRDRRVQRTVDLTEPEITAVAAAAMTPDAQLRNVPTAVRQRPDRAAQ